MPQGAGKNWEREPPGKPSPLAPCGSAGASPSHTFHFRADCLRKHPLARGGTGLAGKKPSTSTNGNEILHCIF